MIARSTPRSSARDDASRWSRPGFSLLSEWYML